MKFRIGHGIDIHAFEAGDHVMLGGIKLPHTHGIKAHSDGDVVLHAIADALLGALGMGDLGQWFPDSDPNLKNIQSKDLLLPMLMSMRGNGYELNNLDVTIISQAPKVSDYSDKIRANVASIFSVDINLINIKATTTEHLGYIGRKEGICAHAILSLIGSSDEEEIEYETITLSEDAQLSDTAKIRLSELTEDEGIDLSQEIDIRDFDFGEDEI